MILGERNVKNKVIFIWLCGLLLMLGIKGTANAANDLLQVHLDVGPPAVVNFTTEIKATITNISTQSVTNVSAQLNLPTESSVTKLFVNNIEQPATTTVVIGSIGTDTPSSIRWQIVFTQIATYTITLNVTYPDGTIATSSIKNIFRNPNIIIADRDNHRVIEVDSNKKILWQYGVIASAGSDKGYLNQPHDARRLNNGNTLIADYYNHRVIEVDSNKKILWQYGITASSGSGYNQLNQPISASRLENGNTLITDYYNNRVIEVNQNKDIVWNIGNLSYPCDVEKLDNGNILIADHNNHRVIEVDCETKNIVWNYTGLNYPCGASKLNNGHILITDRDNHRVIEIDENKNIVWQYGVKGVPATDYNRLKFPRSAIELTNGNILITDHDNHRVIEVNKDKVILWQYGGTGVAGSTQNRLNNPYDGREVFAPTAGCISGKVTRASDGGIISGVTLLALIDEIEKGSTTTMGDGRYILELPAGTYTIQTVANGYATQTQTNNVLNLGQSIANLDFNLSLIASRTTTTLIADPDNHRVIEVDSNKNILWQYGVTASAGSDKGYLNHPLDARRLNNGNTLIADCYNHRVIEVDSNKKILWQYGITASSGSGYNQLNQPISASRLENGNTLITDCHNNRVIEVNQNKDIVWNIGNLSYPVDAERLDNGNILITDHSNHRVIEVDYKTKNIVWNYTGLNYPCGASKLNNGHILITDRDNHRVIEVDENKNIVWQYGVKGVSAAGYNRLKLPRSAIELINGNILITDHDNHRIIEVNKDKVILWQYGETGVAGSTQNRLDNPYDGREVFAPTAGCISGKVTRASDGGVLAGVTIRALQDDIEKGTVTTLPDGTYLLDLPVGSYTLQAMMTGYVPQTKKDIEIIVGKTTNVDFLLTDLFQHIPAYFAYPNIPANNGLIGEYYDNQDFTNLKLVRTDANINFDWGSGSPDSLIGSDYFSIKWQGFLNVDKDDTYTFYISHNDGVRFWIDDKLIIDKWSETGEHSGSIRLTQGLHQIKLEYFEATSSAVIKLYWSSSSIAKTIIPTNHLYEQFYSYPVGAYQVKVKILGPEYQLAPSSLKVCYRINNETAWSSVQMTDTGVDYEYAGIIPPQTAGTKVYYYIEAKDLQGNIPTSPIEAPQLKPYQFKVVALNIISAIPDDEVMNISVANDIKIVFSNAMNPATIGSQTIKVNIGTATVDGVYSYNDENKTVTFEPTERLNEETGYKVVVTTHVQDMASNTIPAEYSFRFHTGLLGNLDEYSRVDGRDLILLGGAFGSTPADTNWNRLADFNKEAESRDRIDVRDLSALASRFGRSSLLSASKSPSITPYIAHPSSVKLASDISQVSAGQEFTIKALIEDAANLYSCGFDLAFDADKFEVIEVKEGDFLNQDSVNTSFMYVIKQGRIIIGASRLEQVGGISGSGILAEVKLKAKESAAIKFSLQKVSIEDSNLRLMGAEAVNLDYTQQTIQPNLKVFCYPNPANDMVTFKFELSKPGDVEVKVYNIAGELIKQIEKKGLSQGPQEIIWQSIEAASGIYIYKFVAMYNDGGEDKTIGRLGVVK